jgi:hypothetical protein
METEATKRRAKRKKGERKSDWDHRQRRRDRMKELLLSLLKE